MRVLQVIAKWVFVLCLPLLFLSASIAWGFNSQWIFTYGFQKFGVSQTTGLSNAELDKIPPSWINYINSNAEYWRITVTKDGSTFTLFTPEEQDHFRDVKQLIWLDYRVLLVTIILVLGFALTSIFWKKGKYRHQLARNVIWGSGLSLIIIIISGIASMLDFDRLFLDLHYLLFTNTDWSAPGYMLLLFPGGFWFDAALICIGYMAGLAIGLGLIAIIYLKLTSKKEALT